MPKPGEHKSFLHQLNPQLHRRIHRDSSTIAFLLGLFCFCRLSADPIHPPVIFDFGTASSPVADRALRTTTGDIYHRDKGYGFTTEELVSFDRKRPLPELRHGGNPMRPDLLYRRHADSLNQDGVSSFHDIGFRIDVKPGKYRVQVWLGDLHASLESMAVECNGKSITSGVSAKHLIGRSKPESTGFFHWIRFDIETKDGRIDLRFHGDESNYREADQRYHDLFGDGRRVDSYLGSSWDPDRRLKFDPNGPFTRNSVLAIRVAHSIPNSVYWLNGKLIAGDTDAKGRDTFIEALNAGNLSEAEAILDSIDTGPDLRGQGYSVLLGHPMIEGAAEQRILSKAGRAIDRRLKNNPENIRFIEANESLEVFTQARSRFLNRGNGEEGHFQENRKVVSMMRLFRPGNPLYYKALQYQGRALQMLDPHRWVYPSGDAQAIWKKLIDAFPENRYARFYLFDEWSPDSVWKHGDHLMRDEQAPDWAIAQREAWGLLLDMCEWWADNKQQPDGGIGGGWGDDVELVSLFGIMGFISEGASQPSLDLATNLIEGLWKYGAMDPQAGFYRGLLDTEHSAEWTGDTLPLMLTIDWENPLWVERATQSAHLMRNLWMDYNQYGDLHFRSNFLGSISVGNSIQANDSYINFRAALPAIAAYQFNRNPAIGKLLVEWADAWLHDALRTTRGKPRGVFPAEVGFPKGEPGGVNSPNWYTATHPPGTVNYDWQRGNYYGYLVDLMFLAQEITGDDRFLEPFLLQKKWVDRFRENPSIDPEPGTGLWVGKVLSDTNRRGAISFEAIWQRMEKHRLSEKRGDPPIRIDTKEVFKKMDHVRQEAKRRWPVLTSETSATDRVGFKGIADPFFIMTGTRNTRPSVTYSGVGREFAAFVRRQNERSLQLVLYSFSDESRQTAVIPWKLEVGGKYQLRTGIDTNGDDHPDTGITEKSFTLARRGESVKFDLAPRNTTIIEIRQTHPGRGTPLLADVAVISSEIKYSIWTRDLQVTLHNVGSKTATKILATFYESDPSNSESRKIGEMVIPQLSWPMDLTAKTLTVGIPYFPTQSQVTLSVVLDESNKIPELCESNNQASRTFEFDLDEIRTPRNRLGEIGGDVTGEIERGIR